MQSPKYVRTSMAAAITLGFEKGLFYRDARLYGLNLLLTYNNKCAGRCAYCGLSEQEAGKDSSSKTFIRVQWPLYENEAILSAVKSNPKTLERVCIAMQTHSRAWADSLIIISEWASLGALPISVLVAPTACRGKNLLELKKAGADMCGVALDCATPELFDRLRGRGVGSPYNWKEYWDIIGNAGQVFGRGKVGIHLIVGLGETEQEMVQIIQEADDRGVHTHLFSFFPESGTLLENLKQQPLGQYRRIQLARYIINQGYGSKCDMNFNCWGRLTGFNFKVDSIVNEGIAFMTSGCPGSDGKTVACNRPYGNERPSEAIRNYPFIPDCHDLKMIKDQLWQGVLKDYNG